jgi:mRNA interferase MazF
MNKPQRGEIWFVNWSPSRGSEQDGLRPSLILQTDKGNLNENYPNTVVLAISSNGKDIPFHIKIISNEENKLKKTSYVKCEQILTISKERLVRKIGDISFYQLDKIEKAVKKVLELY